MPPKFSQAPSPSTSTTHHGGTMPSSLASSSPPMSVELPTSTSDSASSSSSSNNEQVHSSGGSGDVRCSHIAQQLSEEIVREIDSNTWASSPTAKKYTTTIFRAPTPRAAEPHDAVHKRTYHPSFLSIGPYHCGDNATAEMLRNEQGKLWAAGFVLRNGVAGPGAPPVLEYAEAVAAMEADARSCYEGDVGMRQDAFCRMLLLDSCQLIILLLLYFGGAAADADADAGGGSSSHSHGSAASAGQAERSVKTRDICMTVHDLMMLENQIPFFVVDKIYQRYGGGGATATATPPLRSLAWQAMQVIMGGVPAAPGGHDDKQELQHLVHLCHLYLKPTCLVNQPQKPCGGLSRRRRVKYGRFRRATEYYDAGVKFRLWSAEEESSAGGGGSRSSRRPMLDVRCTANGGVLSMALQSIDGTTGYILANVLAFEQKHYLTATSAGSSYVTAYVVFMSQLLGGAEDVALLSSRGVMEHQLGSDAEVCALFRGLADGLFFDPDGEHYLSPAGAALKVHCSHRRNRWSAWIVRHRFGNPWLGAAWLFGASAVLCTIIQTVFSVLAYYVQQG